MMMIVYLLLLVQMSIFPLFLQEYERIPNQDVFLRLIGRFFK